MGKSSAADADHVKDLGDTSSFGGLGAVEARAFGGAKVTSGVVGDGVAGVELGVEAGGFGCTFARGAARSLGGAEDRKGRRGKAWCSRGGMRRRVSEGNWSRRGFRRW